MANGRRGMSKGKMARQRERDSKHTHSYSHRQKSRFLGINSSFLRVFQFYPFFHSTKCYSWIYSSFITIEDYGFLWNPPVKGTVYSKKLESLSKKLMSKNSIGVKGLERGPYCLETDRHKISNQAEKIWEESTHFKAADGSAAYFRHWRSLLPVLKKSTYG